MKESVRRLPVSTRIRAAMGCLLVTSSLLLWGCSSGGSERCDDASSEALDFAGWVQSTAVGSRSAELDEVVVHVDVSSSMVGYVSSSSEFSRVVAGFDQVASGLQPQHSISVRSVGRTIDHLGGVDELRRLAFESKAFNQNESRLVEALESIDSSEPGEAIARCHIFVTDGLQYSADKGLCEEGHDPRCLGSRFRELIESGWGMHVFAIRSRFDGVVDVPGRRQGVRLTSAPRKEETYRPFLLMVLVNGEAHGPASSLADVVAKLRTFLESTVSPSLIRELNLSAPLVRLDDLLLATDEWRLRQRRQANPAKVMNGIWEGPDGRLLPDWIHRVQVKYSRPELANEPSFLLRVGLEISPTGEGQRWLSEDDLRQIADGLRLVELPAPASEEPASPDAEVATNGAAGRRAEVACSPKLLQIRSFGVGLPQGFEALAKEDEVPPEELPGMPASEADALAVESFAELSWSQKGNYPPVTALKLEGPEKFHTTASLPDWVSEWSVDRTALSSARSGARSDVASKNKLLDLERSLGRLASKELVGRVLVEPQYIVLEPCQKRQCQQ